MACLAGDRPELEPTIRGFAHAFGMIITIADDLQDFHRHDERSGNLGALCRQGSAPVDAIAAAVRAQQGRAGEALRRDPARWTWSRWSRCTPATWSTGSW